MRRRLGTLLLSLALVLAVAPAALASEHRDIDDVHADIGLPEEFTLGETQTIPITFENRTEWDITDAVVSMTMRGFAGEDFEADAEIVSGPAAGAAAPFTLTVAEYTASLPEDGFTIPAGETIEMDVEITIHAAPSGGQLEISVVGEIDGEMTSDGDFQDFSLADATDEAPTDTPTEVPAGSGGLAAQSGAALPVGLALVGALLLIAALTLRRRTSDS